MDQLGKRQGAQVIEVCPGCGKPRTEWSKPGVLVNGTSYCCQGCANGTGCKCQTAIPSEFKLKRNYED